MKKSYLDRARQFKRPSQPYPDACESIGSKIGLFHGKFWWHAQGKALQDYKAVKAEILGSLDKIFQDTYHSAICVQLFMIGRCETTAKPMVMIFSEEKEARKKAKKALDDTGLMSKLPGFQTGHAATQPGIGALVQPATEEDPEIQMPSSITTTDVLFDPRRDHHALHIPIFAKQSNGGFRRAIAFLVSWRGRYSLLSVAHVFVQSFYERAAHTADLDTTGDDSEVDLGSDIYGGGDEDDVEITSRASMSSSEDAPDVASDTISPASGSSIWTNPADIMDLDARRAEPYSPTNAITEPGLMTINTQPSDLQVLGTLIHVSIEQDYAIIEIATENLAFIMQFIPSQLAIDNVAVEAKDANVVIYNIDESERIDGKLLAETIILRLPGGSTFREFYQVELSANIAWGDCGALILDATTLELYGHIVASSATRHVAFVSPACNIFSDDKLRWICPLITKGLEAKKCENLPNDPIELNQSKTASFDKSSRTTMFQTRQAPSLAKDLHEAESSSEMQGSDFDADSAMSYTSSPSTKATSVQSRSHSPIFLDIDGSNRQQSSISAWQAYRAPPFASIGNSLDPFRTMFQSTYPAISLEELKFHFDRYFGSSAMHTYWIPRVIETPLTFISSLSIAASHHDVIHDRSLESVQTIALRQEAIHLIGQNMTDANKRLTDHNFIALAHLIASEMVGRKETALSWHEKGLEEMVKRRGGLQMLDARIASTISWLMLECAILREERPREVYRHYCSSTSRIHQLSDVDLPESPLYVPNRFHSRFGVPDNLRPSTIELLRNVRMLIDIFLHDSERSERGRRNTQTISNLSSKLWSDIDYPSSFRLSTGEALSRDERRHDAVRITGKLLSNAIHHQVSLSHATSEWPHERNSKQELLKQDPRWLVVGPSLDPEPAWLSDTPPSRVNSAPSFFSKPIIHKISRTGRVINREHFQTETPASEPQDIDRTGDPLQTLKEALEQSDLSDCWGNMAGVLLWISLTAGAASRNSAKSLQKFFSALTVRVSFMLCFEHPEALHSTLLRMSELVEALNTAAKEDQSPERSRDMKRAGVDEDGLHPDPNSPDVTLVKKRKLGTEEYSDVMTNISGEMLMRGVAHKEVLSYAGDSDTEVDDSRELRAKASVAWRCNNEFSWTLVDEADEEPVGSLVAETLSDGDSIEKFLSARKGNAWEEFV
ncbi:hypothetical protein EK21DRAFT_93008 [Setomelanomma holmii]|uniref:Uncharacterized protein n=1 Tax=Setomelanomma holmii TaxID=210430 RepID=A0A9P4GZT8_9PLEO|nr:hypothetical protein EK21DRAFT_93008 [Setomelanomma holmii]